MDALRPTIAILNASADTVDVLRERLASEGVSIVHAFIREFRCGSHDIGAFVAEHRPHVVIWDLSIPYYQNWTFLRQVQDAGTLAGRGVILTTSNLARLDAIVGAPTGAIELAGTPRDLGLLVEAVRRALRDLGIEAVS